MATKKKTTKTAAKPYATYEGVTLQAMQAEITKTPQLGRMRQTGEKEFTFEGEENVFSRDTKRRWYTKSISKPLSRRLTKNIETGEYKVTYSLDKEILERLNGRLIHDMANDLEEILEKIIFINK